MLYVYMTMKFSKTLNMKGVLSLILIWISAVACQQDVGDNCTTNDEINGKCELFEKCKHAQYTISVLKQKPTYCSISGNIRIVCCTENSKPGPTPKTTTERIVQEDVVKIPDEPIRMSYQAASIEGILWSKEIVCRFDGSFPIVCMRSEYPSYRKEPDPPGCPEIPPPALNENTTLNDLSVHTQVVYEACSNYTKEAIPCVLNQNTGNYVRETCALQIEKISGGDPAQLKEYPHMAVFGNIKASVAKHIKQNFQWWGGGSLISEYFILTAAHALSIKEEPVRFAMLGGLNKTDVRSGAVYQVVKRIYHPKYRVSYKLYDIALLELSKRVTFNEFIRPACLNAPDLLIQSFRVVAGWGATYQGDSSSHVLMKTRIAEIPDKVCNDSIRVRHFVWNGRNMICAGSSAKEPGKTALPDTCKGDSGGPLMSELINHKCSHVVVGIVSFGLVCGKGQPGVYTKVSYIEYLKWIVALVWPESFRQKMHPTIELT